MTLKTVSLTLKGVEPQPQARPRFFRPGKAGRVIAYSPKTDFYEAVLLQARLVKPQKPLDGPLELSAYFYFTRPKSVSKAQVWKWKRPDADNVLKGVQDALLKAGWMVEDSRICAVHAFKSYAADGQLPGVKITLAQIADPAYSEDSDDMSTPA